MPSHSDSNNPLQVAKCSYLLSIILAANDAWTHQIRKDSQQQGRLAPYLATKGKAGVQAFQPKSLNSKGFTDKKKGSYKE